MCVGEKIKTPKYKITKGNDNLPISHGDKKDILYYYFTVFKATSFLYFYSFKREKQNYFSPHNRPQLGS